MEEQNDEQDPRVDQALDLIATIFPDNAETISTIAFVNWHNILNHASLEELDSKEILFVANLILALAASNFDNSSHNILGISDALKEVSFDDSLDFLSGKDKKKKRKSQDEDS